MKCPSCGAPENEDEDGARAHTRDCELVGTAEHADSFPKLAPEGGLDAPACPHKTCPHDRCLQPTAPPPADTRVLQFVGHLSCDAVGAPLQLDVLINGRLAATYDVSEASELSVGDAVDLALANEGRRVMSAPLA